MCVAIRLQNSNMCSLGNSGEELVARMIVRSAKKALHKCSLVYPYIISENTARKECTRIKFIGDSFLTNLRHGLATLPMRMWNMCMHDCRNYISILKCYSAPKCRKL